MQQNYFLLLILIATTIFKALADGFHYLYETTKEQKKKKRNGILYHLFAVAAIGIPITAICLDYFRTDDLWLIITGFACIYFGIFDALYNRITGRNAQYIGKTDVIDILLGKVFDKGATGRMLLHVIRWGFFIFGIAIILDLI